MKPARIVVKFLIGLLLLGAMLTMSERRPGAEYRLVTVGGMGNSCQCTSRIDQ